MCKKCQTDAYARFELNGFKKKLLSKQKNMITTSGLEVVLVHPNTDLAAVK